MYKRMWIAITAILLTLIALAIGVSATDAENTKVYLPSKEASTLADAFALLQNGGEIIVTEEITVKATTLAEVNGNVTVTAENDGCLVLSGNLSFAKNTNENTITLDLPLTANGHAILGGFNSIVFGQNFAVTDSLNFYGGVQTTAGKHGEHDANYALNQNFVTELPYSVTVNNGIFDTFVLGNRRSTSSDLFGSIAAPVSLTVNGGTFNDVFNLSGMSFLADDATLTVNGGTFNCPIYAQGAMGAPRAFASYCSEFVMSDANYYAVDGDIEITLNGGSFNGGIVSAHETVVSYTQCLRGDFDLTVGENAVFKENTLLDATQVKAYRGEEKKATLTCPDASKFTVKRFDTVNGTDMTGTFTEPLRISFVGDSITEGTGSSDQLTKSYSANFASLCEAAGKEVIIGNYGVGGSTILSYGISYYNETLAYSLAFNEADSDYVLIALGTNDASAAGSTIGQMQNFTEKYEAFVKSFAELPDTEKVFTTSATYRFTDSKGADIRAVSVVRPTQKLVTERLAKAEPDKYFYIDLYALLYDAAVTDALFAKDKLHPDDGGYVIYGKAIYDAIFNDVRFVDNFEMSDIYLRADGKLDGSGTKDDPMSSLTTAFGRLAPTGTLHIMGEFKYEDKIVTPVYMDKLTIVGEGDGAKLFINGNATILLSDAKLDNFTLDTTYTSDNYLACCWNNVELTETFNCNEKYRFLAGQMLWYNDISKSAYHSPKTASSVKDITITVNGGTFYLFLGGNWRANAERAFGTYSGNMTLNIGKGVTIKPNGYNGIGGMNYLTGTVTANIDSWPDGQLCRDYPRIGSQNSVNVFDESNNTGTVVMNFGEGVNAKPIITGDFNDDDVVDLADVLHMLKIYVNGHDGSEIHDFYSLREIKLLNVLRALKKII